MSRAQDVLDWIDVLHDLCTCHSSLLVYQRYGMWGTGIQLNYDYDKHSPTHLRIISANLL